MAVVYVNEERTILVQLWPDGSMTVAFREDSSDIWGPPVDLRLERS